MTRRAWLWLIPLWAFATAFNLAKPFHIDDPQFLDTARWIAQHPLHPMQGPFDGWGYLGRISGLDNPHLISYAMAAWGAVFGYSEIAMHSLQSLFTFGDILLFFLLARMVAPAAPRLLTALFALSPALVVGQNMMLDPALMVFWLGFFYCLLRAHESGFENRWLMRAGLCAAAAVLTKYSGVVLIAIALVDGAANRRPKIWRAAAIPCAALAAWSAFNLWDYGGIHLLGRARPMRGPGELAVFAAAWLLAIGALIPFTLCLMRGYVAEGKRGLSAAIDATGWMALLGLAGLAAQVATVAGWEHRADILLTVTLFVNAAVLLILAALALRGETLRAFFSKPRFLFVLWFAGAATFYLVFAVSVTSRHVLVALTPLLLLIGSGIRWRIPTQAAAAGLITTALLTGALAISDWRFAEFYRSSAYAIANQYRGKTVWFTAHWAWQYYAREAGLQRLDVYAPRLRVGDLIAMPAGIAPDQVAFAGRLRQAGRLERQSGPWDLFCTANPSRFYATTTPVTPWTITNQCTARIDVMVVESIGP